MEDLLSEDNVKSGDELLIEIVKQYPPIFNKTHKDHKNNQIINNCWEEISRVVELTVKECQDRFRRLKQYFSRERVLKQNDTLSDTFLEKHMVRRRPCLPSVSTVPTTVPASSDSSALEETPSVSASTPSTSSERNVTRVEASQNRFKEPTKKRKIDPLEQSFLRMNSAIETLVYNVANQSNNNDKENSSEEAFSSLVKSELEKRPEGKRKK